MAINVINRERHGHHACHGLQITDLSWQHYNRVFLTLNAVHLATKVTSHAIKIDFMTSILWKLFQFQRVFFLITAIFISYRKYPSNRLRALLITDAPLQLHPWWKISSTISKPAVLPIVDQLTLPFGGPQLNPTNSFSRNCDIWIRDQLGQTAVYTVRRPIPIFCYLV